MLINTLLLSRIQFGFTIGFHILFPTLNLGLAMFLTVMEALWLKTRDPIYLAIAKFWTTIFALTFGVGVVSGVVLSYELGTNFGLFTEAVGSVLGPLFSYEVLSAFFLEAGFLGVMLFGWTRVGPKMHFCATLLVTLGTTISAFWIMAANSWMQTPAGTHSVLGKFVVDSWWHVIFNPSFIPRYIHMIMASYVTTCFVVAGVSAWYLLAGRHLPLARKAFSFAIGAALVAIAVQLYVGDSVGREVHNNQPLKTAAMEGVWDTGKGLPFVVFAIPDEHLEKNLYAINIPYMASIINTHHVEGELIGLKSVAPAERPIVTSVFFAFRVMLGVGCLLCLVALIALWLRIKGHLYDQRWFLKLCVLVAPLGFVSSLAGWITAESGRQPWVVYGLMRTIDGASVVAWHQVLISLSLFIIAYGFVFSFYLYYLFKLIRKGPPEAIHTLETDRSPFAYQPGSK